MTSNPPNHCARCFGTAKEGSWSDHGGPSKEGKQTKVRVGWGWETWQAPHSRDRWELTADLFPAQRALPWCCKFRAYGCLLKTLFLIPQITGLLVQPSMSNPCLLALASPEILVVLSLQPPRHLHQKQQGDAIDAQHVTSLKRQEMSIPEEPSREFTCHSMSQMEV